MAMTYYSDLDVFRDYGSKTCYYFLTAKHRNRLFLICTALASIVLRTMLNGSGSGVDDNQQLFLKRHCQYCSSKCEQCRTEEAEKNALGVHNIRHNIGGAA